MYKPKVTEEDIKAVAKALSRGDLSARSKTVRDFEEAFAKYVGAKHAIAVNSGSSAVFLALEAIGVKDQTVICPAFGYIAVPNAIVQAHGRVGMVDVEMETGNINPEQSHDRRIKVMVTIDTYGHPCDYDTIKKNNPGMLIIEDAAEALGAKYKGKMVGSLPHVEMTCFSFFANKIITTGEGGMITTNSDYYWDRLCKLRDQFTSYRKYFHSELGYSLGMSAMQAALGLSQLERIDEILKQKRENYLEVKDNFLPPLAIKDYAESSHWVYPFIMSDRAAKMPLSMELFLRKNKYIEEFRPFFIPYNKQPAHVNKMEFPNSDYLAKHGGYILI